MKYFKINNGKAVACQQDINGFPGTWVQESAGYGIGDLYDEVNGWSHPVKTTQELEDEGRQWRDAKLKNTDFIVPTTDYPNHAAWLTYRQELRDWPSTENFPETKPTKP